MAVKVLKIDLDDNIYINKLEFVFKKYQFKIVAWKNSGIIQQMSELGKYVEICWVDQLNLKAIHIVHTSQLQVINGF